MTLSGMSPDGTLPEIVERPDHPWFVGGQFHPELKSRPMRPHPLFVAFVAATKRRRGDDPGRRPDPHRRRDPRVRPRV